MVYDIPYGSPGYEKPTAPEKGAPLDLNKYPILQRTAGMGKDGAQSVKTKVIISLFLVFVLLALCVTLVGVQVQTFS